MEPESSLLCSQEPSTGPYPEPNQSRPRHPILILSTPNIITVIKLRVQWAGYVARMGAKKNVYPQLGWLEHKFKTCFCSS
jgi:hypothetical protein